MPFAKFRLNFSSHSKIQLRAGTAQFAAAYFMSSLIVHILAWPLIV